MAAPKPPAINWRWNGEVMEPDGTFARRRAARLFSRAHSYRLAVEDIRSTESHRHEFGWLRTAWASLHERYRDAPWAQSPEHLRKYALIRGGFCRTEAFPCKTREEAKRWAARLRPFDEFSIVTVTGTVVTRYTAASQSYQSMGGAEFQRSKRAVLEFVAGLLEVDAHELEAQGRAA